MNGILNSIKLSSLQSYIYWYFFQSPHRTLKMWLLLPLLASLSLFASSAQAVTAQAFFFTNCNSFRDNGKCTNLAQNTCCTFRPTPGLPTAAKERSYDGSTQSVKWTSLRRCLVLHWYYPKTGHRSGPGHPRYNCGGRVRRSDSTGEHTPPSVCLSGEGPEGRDDGAQWFVTFPSVLIICWSCLVN